MEEKPRFLDNPRNVKLLIWIFYGICALLLAADLIYHRHAVHPWERIFGFYAFYGLGAYMALVVIAEMLRKILMRNEDYYDSEYETEDDPKQDDREIGHGI